MKKLLFSLTALFLFATIIQAQNACPWAKKAGGTYEDAGTAISTDAQGNVYTAGYYFSSTITFGTTTLHNTYGGEYLFITKQDSCGNFIWVKQAYGKGGGELEPTSIATDTQGNIYVCGYTNADTVFGAFSLVNSSSYYNAFLFKLNSSGVAQWATQTNGNDVNIATGVATSGNNVYLTGYFASASITLGSSSNTAYNYTNDGYTKDVFIAQFDNNGNNLWVKSNTSNGATNGDVRSRGISADAAGNTYVAGYFESDYIRFNTDSVANNGYYDIYVVKYDVNGNYQWLRTAGGSSDDRAYAIATDASGNSSITGIVGSSSASFGTHSITNNGGSQAFIAKYDANGNDLWANCTQGDYYSYNFGNGISLDANGDAYLIGAYSSDVFYVGSDTLSNTSYLNGNGGDYFYDVFVSKYTANGMFSWSRAAGGDSNDVGYGIATGVYKNLYITGIYKSPAISFAGITLSSTNNTYGDAFIANNISTWTVTPQICLASADSMVGTNQYNVIYWDKTSYTAVANFIIYRETSTNVYTKIASVPFGALSEYVDTARHTSGANGDPAVGTYRYAIQLEGTNGTYSYMSPYHNTIYFQNNSGTFSWNLYTVGNATYTPVTNFYLMRDDNNTGNYQPIGTVSGNQTSLTDPNYSTYASIANWRVDADGFNCTPTYRLANNHNGVDAARVKSHSNSTNNRQVGIEKYTVNNQFSIYPNPTNSILNIALTNQQTVNVQIFDVLGNEVLKSATSNSKQTSIDVSNLNSGVYFVKVGNSTQKFIKE